MLTQARLMGLVNYDPTTGLFTWRVNRGPARVGKVAGHQHASGYVRIKLDGQLHDAHRLTWLYFAGCWPAGQIDHINGAKNDNRLANLRVVTHRGNMLNQDVRSSNTSGKTGVSYHRQSDGWMAQISTGSGTIQKFFKTFEDAVAWRQTMERTHGYTEAQAGRNSA